MPETLLPADLNHPSLHGTASAAPHHPDLLRRQQVRRIVLLVVACGISLLGVLAQVVVTAVPDNMIKIAVLVTAVAACLGVAGAAVVQMHTIARQRTTTFCAPGALYAQVLVILGRRIQVLVHRAIQQLDEAESHTENPEMLEVFWRIDHLFNRVRREADNQTVVGGDVNPHRQWTEPVSMTEVLMAAAAEVDDYQRVEIAQPVTGSIRGDAVANVIHMLALLIENATSLTNESVVLRVTPVKTGLDVNIQDRGWGMPPSDLERWNHLLAHPNQIDLNALLEDGRLGLYVVATHAARYNIRVLLQTNIFGGIDAHAVLPPALLGEVPQPTGVADPIQSAPVSVAAPDVARSHRRRPEAQTLMTGSLDKGGLPASSQQSVHPWEAADSTRRQIAPAQLDPQSAGQPPALPRRQRQHGHTTTNGAPQGPPRSTSGDPATAPDDHSLLAKFQEGLRSGPDDATSAPPDQPGKEIPQ